MQPKGTPPRASPRGAEMMKDVAAVDPDPEILDLGLGLLGALVHIHRAPHQSHWCLWEGAAAEN